MAIAAMLIDHIAWTYVPTATLLGQVLHAIGRLTAPIMCFFVAEGYHHTRDVKRYAKRLGLFALISHPAFVYFEKGVVPVYYDNGWHFVVQTSVIYPLLLGLVSLVVWHSPSVKEKYKIPAVSLLCLASVPGDWTFIAVLWIFFFGIFRGDGKKQLQAFSLVAVGFACMSSLMAFQSGVWWRPLFQLGVFLAIPLLAKYNGQLGYGRHAAWLKWMFYIFYPLHLVILGFLKYGRVHTP